MSDAWEEGRTDGFDELIEVGFAEQGVVPLNAGDDLPNPSPAAPARAGVDLGVAGSITQARGQLRSERRARLGSPWRDPYTLLPVLVVGFAVGLGIAVIVTDTGSARTALGVVAALLATLGVCTVIARRGPSTGEKRLARVVQAERTAARDLADGLAGTGWTLLHDRLLPRTEHRVSFLAVGPGGVAIIAVVPPGPYLILNPVGVRAGDDELTAAWLPTRLWEMRHLTREMLGHGIGHGDRFTGPVLVLAVEGYPRATKVPGPGWSASPPHRINNYPIRTAAGGADYLRALPAAFGPAHLPGLARLLDSQCRPAPHDQPQPALGADHGDPPPDPPDHGAA